MKVKVSQSCLTLCDLVDYTFYGILQTRILEWIAFPFSRGSFQPRDQTQVSGIADRFFTRWATREAQIYIIHILIYATAKSLQSGSTLCDHIYGSPPGSPIPRILQEWVAISFSNAWKWKVKVKSLSRVRLLVTSWTAAYQAPPSMGFSRQEWVPPALTTKGMGQPPKPPLCPDPWISQSGE